MSDLTDLSTHILLHRLWTKAVGAADYDKAEWRELDGRIARMEKELSDKTGKYPEVKG